MKAALEEWRHWLEGAKLPFVVLTDHRDLEYLRSAKRLNPRQARWSLFFTRFNFKVTYRPGSKNSKADALSRQFDSSLIPPSKEPIIPSNLILAPIKWDIMTEISEPPPPDQWTPSARMFSWSYLCSYELSSSCYAMVHSSPSASHPGITATIQLLSNWFWWPSLQADTINFVQQCTICNVSKSFHQCHAGLLQPLPVPPTAMVTHSHRLCHWSPQLKELYHHPDGIWSFLQGMPSHTP